MKDDENKFGIGLLVILIIIVVIIFIVFKPSNKPPALRNNLPPANREAKVYYDHVIQTVSFKCPDGKNIEVSIFARTRNALDTLSVSYGDLMLGNLTRVMEATEFVYENNEYIFSGVNNKPSIIKKVNNSKTGDLIVSDCTLINREFHD